MIKLTQYTKTVHSIIHVNPLNIRYITKSDEFEFLIVPDKLGTERVKVGESTSIDVGEGSCIRVKETPEQIQALIGTWKHELMSPILDMLRMRL